MWWIILLAILGAAIVIYIILFLMNIIFIKAFEKYMRKQERALDLVLNQKYSLVQRLTLILQKNKVEIDEESLGTFLTINCAEYAHPGSKLGKLETEKLSQCKMAFVSLGKEKISFNEEFKMTVELINNCDSQIRTLVASYNYGVVGYNYWIRFKPFRYIYIKKNIRLVDTI